MFTNYQMFELNDGYKIPKLGLTIEEVEHDDEIEVILNRALDVGIRYFDTAYSSQNEREIGKVFQKWFTTGKIRREEIYIGAKLPPIGMWPYRVNEFLKISLQNLCLDYVDLYLIEYPVGFQYVDPGDVCPVDETGKILLDNKIHLEAIWKAMEKEVQRGRTKSIGVCNFNEAQLQRILQSATISPSILQIEVSACAKENTLKKFCVKNYIYLSVTSWLVDANHFMANDPIFVRLSAKYNKSAIFILLRFFLQSNIGVVQNCQNLTQLAQVLEIFSFELELNDMEDLRKNFYSASPFFTEFYKFSSFRQKYPGIELHPEFPWK